MKMTRRERTESREFGKLLNHARRECDAELHLYYGLAQEIMDGKYSTKKEHDIRDNSMAFVGSAIAQEYDMSICLDFFGELNDRLSFLEKRLKQLGVLKRTVTYTKKKVKRRERLFRKIERHYAALKGSRTKRRVEIKAYMEKYVV
jgi:hypothetical protein